MDEREERDLRRNIKNNKGKHNMTKTAQLFSSLDFELEEKDERKERERYKKDNKEEKEKESVREKIDRLKNSRFSVETNKNESSPKINISKKSSENDVRSRSLTNIYEDEEEDEEEEEKKKGFFEKRREKKELQKRLKEKRERIKESRLQEKENKQINHFKIHVKFRKIIKSNHFLNLFIQSFEESKREKIQWMSTVWKEIEFASEFLDKEEEMHHEEEKKSSKKLPTNDYFFNSDEDSSTIDDLTYSNFQQTLTDIYRFYLSTNLHKIISSNLQKKLDECFKNNFSLKTPSFSMFEEVQKEIEKKIEKDIEKFYQTYLEALSFSKQNTKVNTTSVSDLFTDNLNGYLFLRAGSIPRILDWIIWNKYEGKIFLFFFNAFKKIQLKINLFLHLSISYI